MDGNDNKKFAGKTKIRRQKIGEPLTTKNENKTTKS